MGDDAQALGGTITFAVIIVVGIMFFICALCSIEEPQRDRAADPEVSLQQRAAMALAAHEARALRAAAILAEQAAAPPVQEQLPYFPYAAQGRASETLCAICVEPLRQGQLCSEVTACRHAFHRDCLGAWARSKGSCPLCRARMVPGSEEVAVADDMV